MSESTETKLIMVGSSKPGAIKPNRQIQINGTILYLQPRTYDYLLALVNAMKTNDGWLHKDDLPGVEWEKKYALIYRLREQIEGRITILNDKRGHYKLVVGSAIIKEPPKTKGE